MVPKPELMRAAAGILALSVGAAAPGSAQSAASQEVPIFGTGVRVVAVPVFVTDKSGRAVEGLTAADFEIKDQKHRVPIVAFQAVDASAPDLPTPNAGLLVQAAARRQILFLFDLSFSTPTGVVKARRAAIQLTRTALAPGDLVAAATYSQSGIRVLIGFSPDHEQVARAIESLGLREDRGLQDPLSLAWELGINPTGLGLPTDVGTPRQEELDSFFIDQLKMQWRADNLHYGQRVNAFLGGLSRLAGMLDGLQGRKHVILLSGGFDQWVLQGERGMDRRNSEQAILEGQLSDVQGDHYFGDATSGNRLRQIYDALAASDTVIHTVEIGGMAARKAGMEQVENAGQEDLARGRDSLANLASSTGGRFVHDANDLVAGLHEILDATRYYYVLAFEPSDDHAAGKLRKLSVDVKREGLSVSHRAAYVLPDPARAKDSASWQVQAAETIAKGLSGGPIALRAVGVPYRDANGATRLPVVLEIDGRSLARAGVHELKLQIYGYAFDGMSRVRDAFALSPAFDLDKLGASIRERNAAGHHLVRRARRACGSPLPGARHGHGARGLAALGAERAVVRRAAAGPVIAPLRGRPEDARRGARGDPRQSRTPDSVPAGGAGVHTGRMAHAQAGSGREVCVFAWSAAGAAGPPRYEVKAELLDAEGAHSVLVAGSAQVVHDADGFERVVMNVDPGSSRSGEPVLRVRLVDPATGATGSTEVAVRVE